MMIGSQAFNGENIKTRLKNS